MFDQSLERAVDEILQDFTPMSRKNEYMETVYPMNSIIVLLQATGQMDPLMLEQLVRVYSRQLRQKNQKQLFVTRAFILNQLKNPNISVYSSEDKNKLVGLLMGDKTQARLQDLVESQEKKQMLQSSKVKKRITVQQIENCLESMIFSEKK